MHEAVSTRSRLVSHDITSTARLDMIAQPFTGCSTLSTESLPNSTTSQVIYMSSKVKYSKQSFAATGTCELYGGSHRAEVTQFVVSIHIN